VGSGVPAAGEPEAAGELDAAGEPDATGEPDAAGEPLAAGDPDAEGEALGWGAATREIEHVPFENKTDVPAVSTTAVVPLPLPLLTPPPPVVGGSVAAGEPSAPVVLVASGVPVAMGG